MEVAGAAFPITPLLTTCTKIVKILHDVGKKFKRAPLMMTSIATECSLIHVALAQLRNFDWAGVSSCGDGRLEQLTRSTEAIILGCTLTLSVIEEYAIEVQTYVDGAHLSPTEQMGIMARVRLLWKEEEMRELLLQLRGYQTGLTNLLRAAHDSTFLDGADSLATHANTFATLLQRSRSSRSRKPLSITAAMQQSMTYTNLSRSGSVSQLGSPAMATSRPASIFPSLPPVTDLPTPPEQPHLQNNRATSPDDLFFGSSFSKKQPNDKPKKKRPVFLALNMEESDLNGESRVGRPRRDKNELRKSSPTVGETFRFVEGVPPRPDSRSRKPQMMPPMPHSDVLIETRFDEFSLDDIASADEEYNEDIDTEEEHLEDPPLPPPVNHGAGSSFSPNRSPDRLDPITEEQPPLRKQESSPSVREQIIALPETARLRKQASGDLASRVKDDEMPPASSMPQRTPEHGHPEALFILGPSHSDNRTQSPNHHYDHMQTNHANHYPNYIPNQMHYHTPSNGPPRSDSLDAPMRRRPEHDAQLRPNHSSDPTPQPLRPRRQPQRPATDVRTFQYAKPSLPPPQEDYSPAESTASQASSTTLAMHHGGHASTTAYVGENETWPLAGEGPQYRQMQQQIQLQQHQMQQIQMQHLQMQQMQAYAMNNAEHPTMIAMRNLSPDLVPRPSRSVTPYSSTPKNGRSRSNTAITSNSDSAVHEAASNPTDDSSSMAGSVMSAQWYRHPRERLGLGSRISRTDMLPWEQLSQEDLVEEGFDESKSKTPPRARKGPLFSVFPPRAPSRMREDYPTGQPPPRSPLLTEKFLVDVKTTMSPDEENVRRDVPERSLSTRSNTASGRRTLDSRDGSNQSETSGKSKKKERAFPTLGELVTEYKTMTNKWYTGPIHEGEGSARPSSGSASARSNTIAETITSNGVQNDDQTIKSPRLSRDTGSTSSKSARESKKEKKEQKKEKKPSLLSEMLSEYKTMTAAWYTNPYKIDERDRERRRTPLPGADPRPGVDPRD